jgi:glucoamylase
MASNAPGWPGITPTWTTSAKSGVGTALGRDSHVWFTLSHGILNEVFYPRVDSACTRDLGLIVTDGLDYFSEEKRDTRSEVTLLAPGVPAYLLRNESADGRYRIEKEVLTDPRSDVVLQWTRFTPLQGAMADYRLHALLAPHLNNRGADNTAWIGDYRGMPMLFAERDGYALALASSVPWLARSAGFVGTSDGWQELHAEKQLRHTFDRAARGNVALTGEIDLASADGHFVLALGFGTTPAEAGQRARASLLRGFPAARAKYVTDWAQWQATTIRQVAGSPDEQAFHALSAAVMRVHESKHAIGGIIASLSVPWGSSKGDDDLGGYHLVWPRDLVETASAFLAIGADDDARRVLEFLQATQEADGHWGQNMWLDGTPYWSGVQMDETALPILLVDLAARHGAIAPSDRARFWPMVRLAAGFLVRNGPVSGQDRWEEDAGYSPFTLGAEIAALLVAAEQAAGLGLGDIAAYLTETADCWFAAIDDWIYVTGTELSARCGVEGYYVRVAAPDEADAASPLQGFVPIKNRPPADSSADAALIVSPDALSLVRFGLRAPDDPRIVNTVRVIDALLRTETPHGPAWHRYNEDGYGEHADGSPFDGTGIGRAWPLLTGERGHYELASGRTDVAIALAAAMRAFAGPSGMLPEQVWDADDIPERELRRGEASGSARPLVWAHAEYIRLRRSLTDGLVFDLVPQTVARYVASPARGPIHSVWKVNNRLRKVTAGTTLRVEMPGPRIVHWGIDGWLESRDTPTTDTGLGVHHADLPTTALLPGQTVEFTFFRPDESTWEGRDFQVVIG